MTPQNKTIWDRAVGTLASMCLSDKIGQGPEPRAFILTLRVYANQMEQLLERVSRDDASAGRVGDPEETQPDAACMTCGSTEDPWVSRVHPMGYFCPTCGIKR